MSNQENFETALISSLNEMPGGETKKFLSVSLV